VLFVAAAAIGVISAWIAAPGMSLLGSALLVAGVAAYRYFKREER
jgi:hypothetical protein